MSPKVSGEKPDAVPTGSQARTGAGQEAHTPRPFGRYADVPVNVEVEIGRQRVSMQDLASMEPNSIIMLDTPAAGHVDLYVEEIHIGAGELLVINDSLSVRITSLLGSQA
jgi:flagellar motor switch protein FliN/FliY